MEWLNWIGLLVLGLFGICFAAWVLYGILSSLLTVYVELRNRITWVLQTESLIKLYRKHQQEIDEYIQTHYPEEIANLKRLAAMKGRKEVQPKKTDE